MTPEEVRALLEEHGALRSGHFLLTSGGHSPTYVEKARLLEHPSVVARLAQAIVSWYPAVDTVASPAVGAVPLGFAVAAAADARFLYAEREDGRMTLRRGFRVSPGERVLVVEDVVTTGRSAAEVHEVVRAAGATVLGVAALVDRSAGELPFPLRALTRIRAEVHDAGACPLCERGVPLEAPGSRHAGEAHA